MTSNLIDMGDNKILQQFTAIFSIFMVFFYVGVGFYLILSDDLVYLDRAMLVIIGSTFIFYGLYRAYRAYIKIVEVFFTKDKDED